MLVARLRGFLLELKEFDQAKANSWKGKPRECEAIQKQLTMKEKESSRPKPYLKGGRGVCGVLLGGELWSEGNFGKRDGPLPL